MALPIIGGIIEGVVQLGKTIGGSYLENRKIKAEGKIAITQAKIQAKIKRYEQMGEMDLEAQKGMIFSWKDEFLLIVLSVPAIMCFIPDFSIAGYFFSPATTALTGFGTLDRVPDWYKWAYTGVIAATFGLRTWNGWRKP